MIYLLQQPTGKCCSPDALNEIRIESQEDTSHPDYAPELIEFGFGTTHKLNSCFRDALDPAHSDLLTAEVKDFAAWDWGTKAEHSENQRSPSEWCKRSPISFEAVSPVAPMIQRFFEQVRCCFSSYQLSCETRCINI